MIESLLLVCKKIGLSLQELEYLTVGGLIDYMNEYVVDIESKDKPKTRKATQDDFDCF